MSSSLTPCTIKTGMVTKRSISALFNLSATSEARRFPTTAMAAYFSDLKGDMRTQKLGLRFLDKYVATLEPIDLPKTKMSYSRTLRTLVAKS